MSQPDHSNGPDMASAEYAESSAPLDRDEELVTIVLNTTSYRLPAGTVSVYKLRALPFPPIPAEYDLWLEGPGGEDTFLRDDDEIQVHEGTRVFAAPRSIMAGCPR